MDKQLTTPTTPTTPVLGKTASVNMGTINGELTYDDKVIKKIVGIALEEVDGLLTVDGGFFSNLTGKLVNTDSTTSGINTEVGKEQVAVDMDVVVEYGKDIREIFNKIKEVITREVANMTHLTVIEVNVNVADIKTRQEFEENRETVQDKVTDAVSTTGEFVSSKTNHAKKELEERTEPRVR